jgi:cellulose synthase/poly-beta-1,6-N-acetylglucosamine synthase-like glycosyltransferase
VPVSGVLVAYFSTLAVLALLGVERLLLAWAAVRSRRAPPLASRDRPPVLVQLPLYNERFVVERLLRAVGRLAYPRDRLCVQVLDDSSDDTARIIDRLVPELRAEGLDIHVLRRPGRAGYKAGALALGLEHADPRFELVAIFDADFVPNPDFLDRCVPSLTADPRVALVQARWGHVNRDDSWLTRAQGVFLDGHFGVEHAGRARRGAFFNFNGTAGVWRRAAIADAGGWSADTITEDLDLSYRTQLRGWRFVYRHDVVCPAELPSTISDFRAQQARWVKGSAQTARKLLGSVWRTPGLSLGQRMSATVHLTNNFAYLAMAALAVLLPVAVVVRDQAGWRVLGGQPLLSAFDLGSLAAGTTAMVLFYGLGLVRSGLRHPKRAFDLGWALCIGAGMSLTNAREVWAGLRGSSSEFVRTPKRGSAGWTARLAYRPSIPLPRVGLELALVVYYLAATAYAVHFRLWGALPFLLLYLFGFLGVTGGSLRDAWSSVAWPRPRTEGAPSV